jgi:antibiotic biosynthesis monooxygenase (ABM) superfamily enzyme
MAAAPSQPSTADEPLTVVSARRVRPGREAEFEVWLEGIGNVAKVFPGFLGRSIVRPSENEQGEYVTVFKFDKYANLKRWTESAERREWLEKVRPLCLDDLREHVLTGLERWFTLPARPGALPPPRHKMAAVTLLALYPMGIGLNVLLGPVLAPLPMPLRALVVSASMVLLATYVVMPRMARLFQRWLYPPSAKP